DWVSEVVTSQQVGTLFHAAMKKHKAETSSAKVPNPAKNCILEMAGDVVGSAVLNVDKFKAVTKQRREETREVEWAAFEVELDGLVMQKAMKGEDEIRLLLATTDECDREGSATFETDYSSVKHWMLKRSTMEGRLSKKGFTSVVWDDEYDQYNEWTLQKWYSLELSWA
ncbi:unnamed protein product, partial [Polarella glacialis]